MRKYFVFRGNRGLSLVEAMVGMSLFLVMTMGSVSLLQMTNKGIVNSRTLASQDTIKMQFDRYVLSQRLLEMSAKVAVDNPDARKEHWAGNLALAYCLFKPNVLAKVTDKPGYCKDGKCCVADSEQGVGVVLVDPSDPSWTTAGNLTNLNWSTVISSGWVDKPKSGGKPSVEVTEKLKGYSMGGEQCDGTAEKDGRCGAYVSTRFFAGCKDGAKLCEIADSLFVQYQVKVGQKVTEGKRVPIIEGGKWISSGDTVGDPGTGGNNPNVTNNYVTNVTNINPGASPGVNSSVPLDAGRFNYTGPTVYGEGILRVTDALYGYSLDSNFVTDTRSLTLVNTKLRQKPDEICSSLFGQEFEAASALDVAMFWKGNLPDGGLKIGYGSGAWAGVQHIKIKTNNGSASSSYNNYYTISAGVSTVIEFPKAGLEYLYLSYSGQIDPAPLACVHRGAVFRFTRANTEASFTGSYGNYWADKYKVSPVDMCAAEYGPRSTPASVNNVYANWGGWGGYIKGTLGFIARSGVDTQNAAGIYGIYSPYADSAMGKGFSFVQGSSGTYSQWNPGGPYGLYQGQVACLRN